MPGHSFLHGFLGCPQDFEGDNPHLDNLQNLQSTLVGYSMGGRIALNLAAQNPAGFSKLILIGAHPGLTEDEKPARRAFEKEWMRSFSCLPYETALRLWYEQSLFERLRAHPSFDAMFQRRLKFPSPYENLTRYSLCEQPNYFIQLPPVPILYLYGEHDHKYKNIAHHLKEKHPHIQIQQVPNSGHAVPTEAPNQLKAIIHNAMHAPLLH